MLSAALSFTVQAMITGGPALLSSMCTFAVSAQTHRPTFTLSTFIVPEVAASKLRGEQVVSFANCLQCAELFCNMCVNVFIHLLAVLHNYNGSIVFPKSGC